MSSWTTITNHGAVLTLIGEHGQIMARELEADLEITGRSAVRIIKELKSKGNIQKERGGRANRYQLNSPAALRRHETRAIVFSDHLQELIRDM